MKNRFNVLVGIMVVVAALLALVHPVMALNDANDYTFNGTLRLDKGGTLDTGKGTLKIDGTTVTKTAAELNTVNAGASITGNIPVASITNAAGSVGASIGGNIPVAAVTNAAGTLGSSIGGNIPVAAITNAAGTVGASIGGNIPVAAITNAAGTVGASIGGNIPVAAITNALMGTAYTTNTFTGDGVTNVLIWRTVGTAKILHSITTTP